MRSCLFPSFTSSGFVNSLISSSHLLFGLPTSLLVLILLSSPGCQSKFFLVHLSFCREANLLAIRHFSLLCVSIRHGIFIFFMCSSASLVLLLMSSIHSSSFSVLSIASSMSSWKDTSLSWSLLEFWFEPSSVSLSVAHFCSSSSYFTFSSSVLSAASFLFSICIFFLFERA